MTLISLSLLAAFAFYVMKPEERRRLAHAIPSLLAKAAGTTGRHTGRTRDAFDAALRARTPYVFVMPAVAGLNVMVFMLLTFSPDPLGTPETLIAWGGNFGPRTTNVEWGRLLSSMFLHVGPMHLLATLAALVQAGAIAERLAGRLTFSAVYMMAGFVASAVSLWLHPVGVSAGASGALFGIYGFLAATSLRGMQSRSGVRIPLDTVWAVAPAAAFFFLYNLLAGGLPLEAELAGCAAGFVSGLMLTHDIAERTPAAPRVLAAVAATFAIAAAIAVPLYGLADVRPAIEQMATIENGTSARYWAAVGRFRKGSISSKDLAHVIERSIVPELQSARSRLATLGRIPAEHQALVARAMEFLRLREESWRVRAEALEVSNWTNLRKADRIEMASLETLASITPPVLQ